MECINKRPKVTVKMKSILSSLSFLTVITLAITTAYWIIDTKAYSEINFRQQIWNGPAICYSGYRAGQNPDLGIYPSQGQILEDLRILERHWKVIRTYGADQHSKDILEVIRRERVGLKVMLGIWLKAEPSERGVNEASNYQQIQEGIRLANEYKDIVAAVSVGNESLVYWSTHKVPEDRVIQYVDEVRSRVSAPVTVDDDFAYWRDHGARLARHLDFVAIHTYPIWGRTDIDQGMQRTIEHIESVRAALPAGIPLVIGEAGWASYTQGDLHVPRAGDEVKQKRYFNDLNWWGQVNNVTIFYFEAFDEPWKGDGTEGHWGLFTEKRKAKPVMHDWYPELITNEPTSPHY